VILSRERWKVWLSDAPVGELEAMLEADEGVRLETYPVRVT
jgi:putative SOS response-associated peptidase YedK